jgi:hypothetical protein
MAGEPVVRGGDGHHGPPGRADGDTETPRSRPGSQRAAPPLGAQAALTRHRQGPPLRYTPGEPATPPARPLHMSEQSAIDRRMRARAWRYGLLWLGVLVLLAAAAAVVVIAAYRSAA